MSFGRIRQQARKIVESHDTLLLEPIDINVKVDVVCYSEIDDVSAGQFAIRLDSQTLNIPSVKLANDTSMDLLPITDPVSGLRWWIEVSGEYGFGYEGVCQPDLFLQRTAHAKPRDLCEFLHVNRFQNVEYQKWHACAFKIRTSNRIIKLEMRRKYCELLGIANYGTYF